MAKTETPAEAIQAELAAIRLLDEERVKRVRRAEMLQLPIAAEVTEILQTKSILEARDLLAEKTACLFDNMNIVVRGLVEQIDSLQVVLLNETNRIAAQVEEDRKAAEALAYAETEAPAP